MGITVLSLFDGISCGRIALDKANIQIDKYYASEIDKYAIKVSERNYPDIIRLGDIKDWRNWSIDWSKIDLLIGGSPCQGFSFSGKGLAFDDPRSKLFFVYVDILNHIQSVNPNVKFLLENVVMKKEHVNVITKYLRVKPVMINSSLVSAQSRKRLYWANWVITQPEDEGIMWADIQESDTSTDVYFVSNKMDKWIARNDKRAKSHKVYDKNSMLKMQMVEASHFKGISNQRNFSIIDSGNGSRRYISPLECERLQTLPDGYTDCGISRTQRYKAIGNGWTVNVIAHIFSQMN